MFRRCKIKPNSVLVAVVILISLSTVLPSPRVVQIHLDTAVSDGHYVVVFDNDGTCNGVWIDPGHTLGNATTTPTGVASAAGCGAVPADMFGASTGFGQLLLSITADPGSIGSELMNITNNAPTNTNTSIFGGATGPVNVANIELGRAIPAGTEVTFTVDMDGEVPHLLAVMGGSAPEVTYNSTTDTLTIKTTTFSTTTNAGDTFNSIVGFMAFTDNSLGSTPLRIIAQCNHWVGDIFPLLPGWDSQASVPHGGGDMGTLTARCGTTIYGPVGEERATNTFFPDASIESILGPGISNDSLTAFLNNTEMPDSAITRGVENFGVEGTLAHFTYVFASPMDIVMGVSSSVATVADGVLIPRVYALRQNYPNPFNPVTTIRYDLPEQSQVILTIHDILGREIQKLVNTTQDAGYKSVIWDGTDEFGRSVGTGIYLYQIKADDYTQTRKMLLLK